MQTFKLMPTDGRKSLDNCHVNKYTVDGEEWSDLISYTTRVAAYNHTTNQMSVYSCQSQTTARHINHFLEFYGFEKKKLKELQNY